MRFAILILALLALMAGGAGSAFAHSKLISSVPANGATVPGNFKEVRLDFLEPIEGAMSHFELVNGDGKLVQRAEGAEACAAKSCKFAVDTLMPGAYRINYHVLSADGHVVGGHLKFTVKAAE